VSAPQTLDHAGIARRIPHSGRMCLLHALQRWDADSIHCSAISHRDSDNPLRSASGLLGACAIEYAAQAMALHGSLVQPAGAAPTPGYLASVRGVALAQPLLHVLSGALQVHAQRLAGDERQVLYRFEVTDEQGGAVAEGRATVVLNTPIPSSSPVAETR
jgi:predicted hotdog family 3-hydroxylacyl-ACP dehydratase